MNKNKSMKSLPTNIVEWSATETVAALKNKQVGARDVVAAHQQNINHINPRINAIVEQDIDSVEKQAAVLDNQKDKSGDLFGVPVTTKINIDQKGMANSNGIAAFNVPQHVGDSPVVEHLKRENALIIGRTNTPEFSFRWFTSNALFGTTINPHNKDLTPGGSSGAAAAAVATGMGCIAHGNDLGGSLRYPAYCCGVASIRPSLGRVAAYNPAGPERPPVTQLMSVQGPIARTVEDIKLALKVMSSPSSADPLWVNAANSGAKKNGDVLRIGFHPDPFGDGLPSDVTDVLNSAVAFLQDADVQIVETPVPDIGACAELWGELLFTEMRHMLLPSVRQHGSDAMNALVDIYLENFDSNLSLPQYFRAMQKRQQLRRDWQRKFENIDLMLLPVSTEKPFKNNQDFLSPDTVPAILKAQRPLYAINLLGLPAASVPVSLKDNTPMGVQLVGAMHEDWLCLDAAERIEQRNGISKLPIVLQ